MRAPQPVKAHEFTVFARDFRRVATVYAPNARLALRKAQMQFGTLASVQPEIDEQYEAWKRLNGY